MKELMADPFKVSMSSKEKQFESIKRGKNKKKLKIKAKN